jgi:DNA polymerase III subunit alpha
MGFAGYFLIVQDFINSAKNQGIPVGPGRGSAAGSLVAYALGITNINPLEYNLLLKGSLTLKVNRCLILMLILQMINGEK